jgi:hypothetical protein
MTNIGELIPTTEPGRQLSPDITLAEGFELVFTDEG